MSLLTLQTVWFVLLGVLITGWFVLDGYNLGAGMWHLAARPGRERNQLLRSVAPYWDGHQVWLIAAVGATFAAFPEAYATLLSGLYPLLILLLVALGMRTVSVEYAQKERNSRLRLVWDVVFTIGSTSAIAIAGLILGNVLRGLPVGPDRQIAAGQVQLLSGPAVLIAVLLVLMMAVHGAIWVALKTDGAIRERARRWALAGWAVLLPLTILALLALARTQPHLTGNYALWPGLWALPALGLLSLVVSGAAVAAGKEPAAQAASIIGIIGMFAAGGAGMYPRLLPALGAPELSLTAMNASSSQLPLLIMLGAVAVGLPLVFAYTGWIFWLFRGRVSDGEGGH